MARKLKITENENRGDGHPDAGSDVYAEAADASAYVVVISGCVTEVIVPARVVYAGQWENLPFLSDDYWHLGIQVYHQGIGVVMAEHVSNVGSEPQVAVEPIGELDSGHGRLVVGDVSGLQAKAFLAGEFIGRCRV